MRPLEADESEVNCHTETDYPRHLGVGQGATPDPGAARTKILVSRVIGADPGHLLAQMKHLYALARILPSEGPRAR